MQPAELAIALRRRSPWEATDLGLAMLRRWWRPVYAAHALALAPIAFVAITLGWAFDAIWAAMIAIWWLQPLYDRVVLHVLSRAVFGEVAQPVSVLRAWRDWKGGLLYALTLQRTIVWDLARSFNLPVRQLEGQRGRAARERQRLLGRRARGQAVWLTVVWVHFEAALLWSTAALTSLLLPAQLERTPGAEEPLAGLAEFVRAASLEDALVYAAVIFFLEPFYVAAGFGLYLNRRTVLEGWDIEVALRRIAERHAVPILLFIALLLPAFADTAFAQEKDPKQEIAEVMKSREFGYYRETMRWEPRGAAQPREAKKADNTAWHAIGYALARAAEVFLWGALAVALAYALWWLARRLPREAAAGREAYRPPPALFGMELAPQTLPPDVPAAAAALAGEGRLREALSLLYRGALSELVHQRGVELLASHTEGEAVRLAGMPYFARLVDAWRTCAYAQRPPSAGEVQELTTNYRAAFS